MKTQTEKRITSQERTARIAQKLNAVDQAMTIAIDGLRTANKKNPFWTKSQAMREIARLRAYKNKLARIWCLEFTLA